MTLVTWARRALRAGATLIAILIGSGVWAQDVTITSNTGNLSLTGRVIGFDGTYLTIESDYGPLSLDLAAVTCEGGACPDPNNFMPTIRMSGASHMADILIPALIDGFGRMLGHPVIVEDGPATETRITLGDHVAFSIRGTTTAEGFADLLSFQSDLVMALREVRQDELALSLEVGAGALDEPGRSRIVGLDALVPIAAPTQTLPTVSLSDLSRAFSGSVKSWTALGGSDDAITLHLGPQSDGEVQFFLDRMLGRVGRSPDPEIIYHATYDEMDAAVAADPGGLGIARFGRPTVSRALTLRDGCGFEGSPGYRTIKAQDYPLATPLFLYLPEWRLHPIARDFLAFLRSPDAQLIVRRAGFVDQGTEPVPLDAQGQRFANAIAKAGPEVSLQDLQDMVEIMSDLTRQTVNFRFETGATRLDAGSRSQLLSLAQAIRDGRHHGQTLWLLGFSDGRGDAAANARLSQERANAVRAELTALLGVLPEDVRIETNGFGEALPMACDDSIWGRDLNRRVELWVSSE